MNTSAACLSIILFAALFSQASPAPIGADTTVCCFSYASRKLPQSHVKDYFYTSSKCSQPAVVYVPAPALGSGERFCQHLGSLLQIQWGQDHGGVRNHTWSKGRG
uniref:C-C motif chemokine 5-like n=1 Tax=Strigops habroptila TaxID=2489341 RepID=A0A672UKZ3_STRHB